MISSLPSKSQVVIRNYLLKIIPLFILVISGFTLLFVLPLPLIVQCGLYIVCCVSITVAGISFFTTFLHKITDAPYEMIAESAKLVSGGVTTARIPLDFMPTIEAYRAAESVNSLADKAGKDIAEMKKLERVRSEFLGNVSHELRTPIFSIQGYLETLLEGALEDKEVSRTFVERAHQNTKRLNVLLSELIDISKIVI